MIRTTLHITTITIRTTLHITTITIRITLHITTITIRTTLGNKGDQNDIFFLFESRVVDRKPKE
jgi:hypothetical protein